FGRAGLGCSWVMSPWSGRKVDGGSLRAVVGWSTGLAWGGVNALKTAVGWTAGLGGVLQLQ
ncbi:hypothetical protein ABZV60_35985, partial [Streptomyces sp. NPDC004787]|uniref:hypothetical protein n=1 Tax=Streptomyces sp. NPDC004787 TaxID=3154291 RepID=UPI0033AFFA40